MKDSTIEQLVLQYVRRPRYEPVKSRILARNLNLPKDRRDDVKKIVESVTTGDWTRFTLRIDSDTDVREKVFEVALAGKWVLRELSQENPSLEDVFVNLTMPVSEN